jgi:signal transduction histidine kinase
MLAALRAGREQEAADIFASTIESGLDTLLDRLTADAVARERREVVQALADTDDAASQLRVVALTLAGGAFAAAAALSVFLHRSVLRPVERLAAGAEAVTAGDLSHRVPARRRDELGDLARAFNRMTAEIEDQRSALNAANEGLEREVVSRTAELRDAVGELEAQSEARSRFLADISHELRTPLTVIRGKAEVALHDPRTDAEGARAALERIATKAAQMGRLVDDLLFLARSEAGTIPMRRAPVVLQEVLADVLMDSRDLSERKGIQFVTGQPDEPVIVAGDGDRLRQAVLIPLDNAVQTAPRGSMIRVTLRRSGDIARIVVEDEGAGFDPELLGRAPRRFQHGRAGGTGLGLSIARWIMEGHGGALRLGNGPDGGAVVSLELPAGGAA